LIARGADQRKTPSLTLFHITPPSLESLAHSLPFPQLHPLLGTQPKTVVGETFAFLFFPDVSRETQHFFLFFPPPPKNITAPSLHRHLSLVSALPVYWKECFPIFHELRLYFSLLFSIVLNKYRYRLPTFFPMRLRNNFLLSFFPRTSISSFSCFPSLKCYSI